MPVGQGEMEIGENTKNLPLASCSWYLVQDGERTRFVGSSVLLCLECGNFKKKKRKKIPGIILDTAMV
jgi:hypothetical protein